MFSVFLYFSEVGAVFNVIFGNIKSKKNTAELY